MFYNSSVSEIETALDMNKLWISLGKDPAFWKWIQVTIDSNEKWMQYIDIKPRCEIGFEDLKKITMCNIGTF